MNSMNDKTKEERNSQLFDSRNYEKENINLTKISLTV